LFPKGIEYSTLGGKFPFCYQFNVITENRISTMKKIIALLALSVLTAQVLRSQWVNSDTLTYKYKEIVISASRMNMPLKTTPFSTSVVDSQVLNTLPRSLAIDEPLKLVPGVKVDNQANGERVHMSIRGQGILTETGIRSIKVLLDGLPINDPTGFAPDFFDVDLNTVSRIDVLRGPAASLYGGGAAGGIISIMTQNAPNTPLFGEVSSTEGFNGAKTSNMAANYGGDLSYWKNYGIFGGNVNDVNYRLSFSRTGGEGYRVHTHFWEDNVYAKATYTPSSDFQVTPIFSWTDTYHENPEGLNLAQYNQDPTLPNDDAVPYNEHMEMYRTTEGVTGLYRILEGHELRFNAYAKQSTYIEANNHVFDHQLLSTPGMTLQYTYSSGLPDDQVRNKVSLGTDLQWQTNNEHLNPNFHSYEGDSVLARQQIWQRGIGVFLIDNVELGRDWGFMGSLRFDNIHNELTDQLNPGPTGNSGSADFSNVTGRLGLTYSLIREMTLYGSWGQGFIPPSTEELGTNPRDTTGHYGGFNSDLSAATSNSYEIGARGILNDNINYEATGFYMTTKNDFDRYRLPNMGNGEQGTFYKNIGATKRYGLELAADYEPVKSFGLQVAYTYSHFTYNINDTIAILMDSGQVPRHISNGNFLPNSPQHQLMLDVRYDILPQLGIGLSSETLSKTYIDGANKESEAAASYTLLHARLIYHWSFSGMRGDLTVQGRNLGNTKYVAFTEPDSGGNSYQPGAGREIFVGLKIRLGEK
jgi:iron complex outermembrane receptor protein